MKSCCVIGCEITSEQNITFFEFPTSRSLRRKWLDVIKLSGKPTVNSVVCSQHFGKTDYEEIRGKTRLKRKVVPTLFDNNASEKTTSPKPIENRDCNSKSHQNSPTNLINDNSNHTFAEKDVDEKSNKRNSVKNDIRRQSNDNTTSNKSIENLNSVPENTNTRLNSSKNNTELTNCENFAKIGSSKVSIVVTAENNTKKTDNINSLDIKKNENNSVKHRKTRVKVVPERYPKFCDYSEDSDAHTDNEIQDICSQDPDPKQDIEDIITNYHIKNLKPNKLASPPPPPSASETALVADEVDEEIEFHPVKEADPVFIEVPVDQDPNATEPGAGSQDCLMLLESVQVDVDPATLLLAEPECYGEDSDDDVVMTPVKQDPISLLTSSDEDDVILQEQHIDTVEVSDETDEDDIPLVRLLKKKKKKKESKKSKGTKKNDLINAPSNIVKNMWGLYEYYCIQCKYTTTNNAEYRKHLKIHETVLHICQICGYTTSSLSMFTRHKKKHKDERRFKCHFCDYKARHNMSLVYHLKSHENEKISVRDVKDFVCDRCGFRTDDKRNSIRHSRVCRNKKHSCDQCEYVTKRRSDLKRHIYRRHNDENCDED